jgi:transposase
MSPLPTFQNQFDIFIGLDVDKSSYSFTVCDNEHMTKSKRIPSHPEHLCNYIQKTFPGRKVICAYEAGPTGFDLHDFLQANGIDCLIIAPASIPKAANDRVKNNRIDSLKITDYLMSSKMKSIRVPQGPYRELRHLLKSRENAARDRKTAKQRIKALLLYCSLNSSLKDPDNRWSRNYINELKHIECSFATRQRLDMLLEDLEYARNKTLSIHRILRDFFKSHEQISQYMHYLQSIPGIGFIVAATILGRIGDPAQLQNPRELAAFVGLVPSEHSTGDNINKGPITHLGNQTLRFLLVEAAWVAIRHDSRLDQFYHRIKGKNHPKVAAKIAITAVARKLTQIIFRVLKDKREYVQF